MPNLIIIDSNYIGHVAKHSCKGLSWNDIQTGVIFGFLKIVRNMAKLFGNQFVFAWDSNNSFRKYLDKDYKKNRVKSKTPEEEYLDSQARMQFITLRDEILSQMGFKNNFVKYGFEADDLIASIIMNTRWQGKNVVVSSDEDLWQLLDYCDIWQMKKKKLFTREDFIMEWGLQPQDWAVVKAIGGCSSDNVVGLRGVAAITAAKFLRGDLKRGKSYEALVQFKEALLQKNLPLVKLPFEGTGRFPVVKCQYRFDDFLDVFERYGFNSFLKQEELKIWKSLFELK